MDFAMSLTAPVYPPVLSVVYEPQNSPEEPMVEVSGNPRQDMCDRLTSLLSMTIPEMDLDDFLYSETRQFAPEYSQTAYQ